MARCVGDMGWLEDAKNVHANTRHCQFNIRYLQLETKTEFKNIVSCLECQTH